MGGLIKGILRLIESWFAIYNVKHYGATGNGTTDDTTAVQQAINASVNGQCIIPAGTYLTGALTIPSNATIILQKGATLQAKNNVAPIFSMTNVSNITIRGENSYLKMNTASYTGGNGHAIDMQQTNNVLIDDLYIQDTGGDGIYIGGGASDCQWITIQNTTIDAAYRNGVSITYGSNITIKNCKIINTSGTSPQLGVDVEANVSGYTSANVQILDCYFSNNAGGNIDLPTLNDSCIVRGCVVDTTSTTPNVSSQNSTNLLVEGNKLGNVTLFGDNSVIHDNNIFGQVYINGTSVWFHDNRCDSGTSNTVFLQTDTYDNMRITKNKFNNVGINRLNSGTSADELLIDGNIFTGFSDGAHAVNIQQSGAGVYAPTVRIVNNEFNIANATSYAFIFSGVTNLFFENNYVSLAQFGTSVFSNGSQNTYIERNRMYITVGSPSTKNFEAGTAPTNRTIRHNKMNFNGQIGYGWKSASGTLIIDNNHVIYSVSPTDYFVMNTTTPTNLIDRNNIAEVYNFTQMINLATSNRYGNIFLTT